MANSASHPSGVGYMSSNPLMMGYGSGDLLLAGSAVAGCRAAAWSLCLQTVCSDL